MKQVEERYEASKMAYRDIKNSIDTAKREGRIEANFIGQAEESLPIKSCRRLFELFDIDTDRLEL